MAPRTVYANLQDGLQPFSLFDQSLADMGSLGIIPCTAVGTNAIVLTPITSVNAPNVTTPQANQLFSFVAAGNSSAPVTIQIGTSAALKLYRMDAVTQATTGDINGATLYIIGFNSALNSAANGFQIVAPVNEIVSPIISGATITGSTITTSTYNGNTWTAGTGILTIAALKTLTASNTITLAGNDGTTMTFPTTSATVARTDAGQTFTGTQAFGALTATTINGNTFTVGSYTLTGTAAKTLTFSNSLTLAGTDATTITFQASDTYVGRATTDTLTNKTFDTAATGNIFKINGVTISANTGTGSNVLATSPTLVTPALGAATATSINGSTVSPGHYSGEPSTGSALAGEIGEYIESVIVVGSAVTLSTGTDKTVTSISLTAGDWDVDGVVGFNHSASTSVTSIQGSLSLTTNVADTTPGRQVRLLMAAVVPNANMQMAIPPYRFSLSGTTSIFLIATEFFTVSAAAGFGIIRARRVR